MDQKQKMNYSPGRIVAGIVLAVVLGAALPLITTLQISLMTPMVLFGEILMIYLYCYAGSIPAAVAGVLQMGAFAFFFSPSLSWIMLFAAILPACIIIGGISAKRPFFEQMRNGLVIQSIGLIIGIFLAYISFGSGMVARLIDTIREGIAQIPEEFIASIVDNLNSTLSSMGASEEMFTADAYRELVSGAMLDYLQESYTQTLPGSLIVGAAFTVIAGIFCGNWFMARRGVASNESFVGMSKWYLPENVVGGLMFVWIVGYLLAIVGYKSGDIVYRTVYMLARFIFSIQALASFNRLFLKKGMRSGKRYFMVTFIWVVSLLLSSASVALMFYGVTSAILGSHGVLTMRIKRHNDDHSDDNH